MKRIIGMLGTGLLYFCVATVVAEVVVLAMLWWKGAIGDDRLTAMLAAMHGIHPESAAAAAAASKEAAEQPSLDDLARQKVLASLDIDLRETTIDKSLVDLRTLEDKMATENERLKRWEEGMARQIDRAENMVLESSLLELQKTLEVISPKQAKEQILKILEASPTGDDARAMNDVVRILKAMPLDKRKKILGEFKTPTESEKLADILREIRLSPVELDMLRDSRDKIQRDAPANR